jgi:hypothetical protein
MQKETDEIIISQIVSSEIAEHRFLRLKQLMVYLNKKRINH